MLDLGLRAENFRLGLCWTWLAEGCGGIECGSWLDLESWPHHLGCKGFQTGLCWM